jgi:hypothetical protein
MIVTQRSVRRWHGAAAALVGFAALAVPAGAQAQDPVAIVEDVTGSQAQVQFMDYVTAGTVIRLGAGDSLILGYVRSCWRETIKGGVVTVGAEQSVVAGGEVKRQKVECDGGRMRLTPAQAGQSGVMVFRRPPTPELTLYGLSPVIDLAGGGRLVIERIDKPGERQEIDIKAAIYDFTKEGRKLTAGGTYRAKTTSAELIFKVDAKARPGRGPIIGRLLKL